MKVIIATDGTKYGDAAGEMAAKFNLGEGDSVTVISVVDMAVPLVTDIYGGYLPDTSELENMQRTTQPRLSRPLKRNSRRLLMAKRSIFPARFCSDRREAVSLRPLSRSVLTL